MAGRAERILVNTLSTYGRMLIGLLLGLATTRAALAALSPEAARAKALFGVFALLLALSTASSLLNDSLRQALVRYLALIPSDDRVATRRMLSTGFALATGAGLVASAVMVLAAPWLVSLLVVPEPLTFQAVQCVRIFGVSHGLNAAAVPWLAALRSRDRFALENFTLVGQQMAILLLVMLVGTLSQDTLAGIAFAYATPPVVGAWLLAGTMAIRDDSCRIRVSFISKDAAREVLALGGWSGLISVATSLYERTDQILVNVFLGPTFNAYYGVVSQLQSYASSLVGAVNGVLLPTATKLSVAGTEWERQQFLLRTTRYSLFIAIPVTIVVTTLRKPLIHAWLGPGFEVAADVLPLGMLLVLLRAPNAVTWPYLTAANRLGIPALVLLVDGVTNVLLSIVYVRVFHLGLAGVFMGTISTSVLRFVLFQGPYTARLTGISPWRYWREGMGWPIVVLIPLAPTLFGIRRLDIGFLGTLLLLSIVGGAYAVGVWRWVFDSFERTLAERFFARIRGVARR